MTKIAYLGYQAFYKGCPYGDPVGYGKRLDLDKQLKNLIWKPVIL